jgi:amino acid transporter
MNTNKDSSLLFANENTIFRIVSIAKIISWIILSIYLISFADNLATFAQQQSRLPSQPWQWIITLVSLFFAPVVGLFYFLVLQGVAQGLNLGLDIYYESQSGEESEQPLLDER